MRPRDFGLRTQQRWTTRWERELHAAYLGRRKGTPRQIELIRAIAGLKWAIAVARHENTPRSLEALREHERLHQRWLDELERSAVAPPKQPTPREALAEIHARYATS
jgi:hypothetical protein